MTKLLRFAGAVQISVAALLTCGPQSYGQPVDPRIGARRALGAAAGATAARLPLPQAGATARRQAATPNRKGFAQRNVLVIAAVESSLKADACCATRYMEARRTLLAVH